MKFSSAFHILNDSNILDQKSSLFDYKIILEHLKNGGRLSAKQITKIVSDTYKILAHQPNLIECRKKAYVVGSLNGNFSGLISVLTEIDFVDVLKNEKVIIFTGNYINQGLRSIDVLVSLLLLKAHCPNSIILLRGSEESFCRYARGSFKKECLRKYNKAVYNILVEALYAIPLCAILNNEIFVSHQGVPDNYNTRRMITNLDRFKKMPMCRTLYQMVKPDLINIKCNEFMKHLKVTHHIKAEDKNVDEDKKEGEESIEYKKLNYKITELADVDKGDSAFILYYNLNEVVKVNVQPKNDFYIHPEYKNVFKLLEEYAFEAIENFSEQLNVLITIRRMNMGNYKSLNVLSQKNKKDIKLYSLKTENKIFKAEDPITSGDTVRKIVEGVNRIKVNQPKNNNFCKDTKIINGESEDDDEEEAVMSDYRPFFTINSVKSNNDKEGMLTQKDRERVKKSWIKKKNKKDKNFWII